MNSEAVNKSTQASNGNVIDNSEENGVVLLWFESNPKQSASLPLQHQRSWKGEAAVLQY